MTTYVKSLGSLTLTANEQSTVQGSVGSEDAQGMLSAISNTLQESIIQLQRLATYLPAGSNLTAINNAIASLQT